MANSALELQIIGKLAAALVTGLLIGGCSASHPLRVDIVSPSPSAAPSPSPQARLTATDCVVSGDVLTVRFINDESQTVYLDSFDVNLYDSQGGQVGARIITASEVSQATALAIAPNSIRDLSYRGVLSLSAAACIMTEWLGGYSP